MSNGPGPDIRLNLGCGHITPDGWVNVDASNRAWLASKWPLIDRTLVSLRLIPPTEFSPKIVYADMTRRLPWPGDSVEAIYMGEVLEHFTRESGAKVVRECYRLLKPNGVLRLRVPDNAQFWKNYLDEYNQAKQRPRGEWSTTHSRWVDMFFRDICVRKPGFFRSMGHFHKCMYGDISLIKLLEDVGFRDVARMEFHKSRVKGVEAVESREDLIVEGVK